MTIRALLDQMAETRGDAICLISPDGKRELSFAKLQQRAAALACRLIGLGFGKGDKIALLLDNGLYTMEVLLGAMYGGLVPVPLNANAAKSELAYVLYHSESKMIFVSSEYLEAVNDVRAEIARPIAIVGVDTERGFGWGDPENPNAQLPAVDEDDQALLPFTSGSTGKPKGVLLSHRSLLAGAANTVLAHQLGPHDRSLCVLPLYHMNALTITLLPTLLSGGCVVLPRRFNANSFWNWVTEYRCTWFALVPTLISHLLQWTDPVRNGADLVQVRFARSSSAPLAPNQHRAFEEKFKLPLIEAMGMTEAGGVIFSNPLPPAIRKIGSAGIPYGCMVTIMNAEACDVPSGQSGEIVVRGASVSQGYFNDSEATAELFGAGGWMRTGDLAYRDNDGYFFIIGRIKELIIKAGENIAPREIDEALLRHSAVAEAAVVGIPDAHWGEDIVGYVVLNSGVNCDERELLRFCRSEIGDFRTPSQIYFVADLPKGPAGKIQRLKLAERAKAAFASDSAWRGERAKLDPLARSTLVEERLASMWAAMLNLQEVGIDDNFFELGGDSLLAMQTMSRIRAEFQVELPLRSLNEATTVGGLAAIVMQSQTAAAAESAAPIGRLDEIGAAAALQHE